MSTLYEKLREYGESDHYGFHMPGHKRRPGMPGLENLYQIDITEIDGFDDLHHAKGILKEAQERAARVFHAQETHFLINGSTAGILSAVAGTTERGDTILVARNCHKSVYHAIDINELAPVYLYPGVDEESGLNLVISPQDVETALEAHPDIRAVVLVSPTYDGMVSDVAAIAKIVHRRGIPLIVDEAHGAHFGFHPYFPENSNTKGADIVVHSLHKTLPSLTQTALLHMNGELVDRTRVRRWLDMVQTSSPSYVLMASIDFCVQELETARERLFNPYAKRLRTLREELRGLKKLRLIEKEAQEPSKLVLWTGRTKLSGRDLAQILLDKYHLQMEMASGSCALAMTAPGDTDEGMERLRKAVFDIDETADLMYNSSRPRQWARGVCPEQAYTCAQMRRLTDRARRDGKEKLRRLPWEECAGAVSTEYAYLYPPGIPLIVPGERICREAAETLIQYREQGLCVEGLKQEGCIEVWTDG